MSDVSMLRAAIYTRKSSEEGLDQAYNSLDAQRDACAAYIQSQAHEGWRLVPTHYDDGGFSGGNIERPALKRLLADIEAGKIDVIVVYKIDRLTRSLTDFAKIVDVLDARSVSFVSVTQSFNTTSSMGRLTLNVLLSFAQFEREVTGERIRDKIAASKKLGMWMGGNVPLGYRARERTLEIAADEADLVRAIYSRYLELGSVHQLAKELKSRGVVSKVSISKAGKPRGGVPYQRGALFHLLRNRVYLGQIPHRGQFYPGQHPAILEQAIFDEVQARLDQTAKVLRPHMTELPQRAHTGAPLQGLIVDGEGEGLTPVTARKSGQAYRYYVSRGLQTGDRSRGSALRLPAIPIEEVIVDRCRRLGLIQGDPNWTEIRRHIVKVGVTPGQIALDLKAASLARLGGPEALVLRLEPTDQVAAAGDAIRITINVALVRRGGKTVAVNALGGPAIDKPKLDKVLASALIKAEAWRKRLLSGEVATVEELAQEEGVKASYVARVIRTAFLSPDLKRAVLSGRQSPSLTLQVIMTKGVPLDWDDQRSLFCG